MDQAWWNHYHQATAGFAGERISQRLNAQGARPAGHNPYGNSGTGAVAVAIARGARRVLLLGYDMQHTGGRRHWHRDHAGGLANAGPVADWPAQFEQLAADHPGVNIINCTRETALRCFPRHGLEQALCE